MYACGAVPHLSTYASTSGVGEADQCRGQADRIGVEEDEISPYGVEEKGRSQVAQPVSDLGTSALHSQYLHERLIAHSPAGALPL